MAWQRPGPLPCQHLAVRAWQALAWQQLWHRKWEPSEGLRGWEGVPWEQGRALSQGVAGPPLSFPSSLAEELGSKGAQSKHRQA